MARSTYQTYLMKKATSENTYAKLIDIKDFPDLGGAPEMLETTTLSDSAKTYITGIQGQEAMEFSANYDETNYSTLKDLEGTEADFAIWFGADSSGQPDGTKGKFSFKGYLSVYVAGGGTNEVNDMKISIAPTTPISFSIAS